MSLCAQWITKHKHTESSSQLSFSSYYYHSFHITLCRNNNKKPTIFRLIDILVFPFISTSFTSSSFFYWCCLIFDFCAHNVLFWALAFFIYNCQQYTWTINSSFSSSFLLFYFIFLLLNSCCRIWFGVRFCSVCHFYCLVSLWFIFLKCTNKTPQRFFLFLFVVLCQFPISILFSVLLAQNNCR